VVNAGKAALLDLQLLQLLDSAKTLSVDEKGELVRI
jgi:hypothetical protein